MKFKMLRREALHSKRALSNEGSGRVSKRRAFDLQAHFPSWAFSMKSPQRQPSHPLYKDSDENFPMPTATCITTLIPTEVSNRRNQLKQRVQGSGRSTQLRSFTLELTLPRRAAVPSPQCSPAMQPTPAAPSPAMSQASPSPALSQASPDVPLKAGTPATVWTGPAMSPAAATRAACSSLMTTLTPGFTFTPVEGVPERAPARRPRQQAQPLPARPAVTPMEGVPERDVPYFQTTSRLARLAMRMWAPYIAQQAAADQASASPPAASISPPAFRHENKVSPVGEEELIHRAGDEVLRSESASPELPEPAQALREGPARALPEEPAAVIPDVEYALPGVADGSRPITPFALRPGHCEVEVQTGVSLRYGQGSEAAASDAGVPGGSEIMPEDHGNAAAAGAGPGSSEDVHQPFGGGAAEGAESASEDEPVPTKAASRPRKSHGPTRENEEMRRRKSLAAPLNDLASPVHVKGSGDGLAVDKADGKRKSTRGHQRPLEYWRNEHKVFGRDHKSLPTVVRIETRTPNPCWPLTDKASKLKKKARTKA